MRYRALFALFFMPGVHLCGCGEAEPSGRQRDVVPAAADADSTFQTSIAFRFGDAREIVAPPGGDRGDARWLEIPVTFTNVSDRPMLFWGYSTERPLYAVATRTGPAGRWASDADRLCATGANEWELAPGASQTFRAASWNRAAGHEFRVTVWGRTTRPNDPLTQATSAPFEPAPAIR